MYRIPRIAIPACATLFLLACESGSFDPPPPPPQSASRALSFEISGPSQIHAEGTYSWEAFAFGGTGEYQYQWDVTRRAGIVTTMTQKKLSLHILESDGNFSLKLTVTSGAQAISQNRDVRNCISACRY